MTQGGVTVVKWGGAIADGVALLGADLAALISGGRRVVVVHGGSRAIDGLARRLGVPRQEIRSPAGIAARRTDAATLELLLMAMLGQVQPALLTELGRRGVPAIGLSGLDAGLLRARRKEAVHSVTGGRVMVVRDDHSGQVTAVNGELLRALLTLGLTPVLCPPALAEDGRPVNSNADRVAARVAVELAAEHLVLLTATAGLLANPADEASVLSHYSLPSGDDMVSTASGPAPDVRAGMAVKLIAAREALAGGVPDVVIADGRTAAPVTTALAGAGTRVTLGPAATACGRRADQ